MENVALEGEAGKSSGSEAAASDRNSQCYEMFEKVAEYLNGELAGVCVCVCVCVCVAGELSFSAATSEEYALLQSLNQITLNKYQDMTALAVRLNEVSQRLNDKC